MIKVAVLWVEFPGYISTCVEALANYSSDISVLAVCHSGGQSKNQISILKNYSNVEIVDLSSTNELKPSDDALIESVAAFAPDIAIISLSRFGLFAKIARRLSKIGTMVIGACDHFWRGTWKDYGNMVASKLGIYSHYEGILVPGYLGIKYAKKLAYEEKKIFQGMYTCNAALFQRAGLNRDFETTSAEWPKVFLFAGQYIDRKGFDVLLKAYSIYREESPEGWDLWLVGEGPLKSLVKEYPPVKDLGRKEPEQLAETMKQSGCFILPSRYDHWGVVIHEAACAGLPILATNTCAASIELIQNGYNGYTFPDDPIILAKLMRHISETCCASEMGKHSVRLSSRYSPELWAKQVIVDIPLFLRGKPLLET